MDKYDEVERTEVFQKAWERHVEGNSFYDLDSMSQPEVDSYRFAYLCGYVDGPKRDLSKYLVMEAVIFSSRGTNEADSLSGQIDAADKLLKGQYRLISVTPNQSDDKKYFLTWELKP